MAELRVLTLTFHTWQAISYVLGAWLLEIVTVGAILVLRKVWWKPR